MLLREGKLDLVAGGEANVLGAEIEMEKNEGNAVEGVPTSDAEEMLVNQLLLARGEPCDVEGERGIVRVEIPKLFSWEDAQQRRGQSLDRVLHFIEHTCLQTQEISRQNKIQDLPSAVRKRLVSKRPS